MIVGERIEPNPWSALFGVVPSLPSLSTVKKDLLAFVTLLARRLILLHWKSADSPTHTRWIRDILHFLKLEKLRLSLQGLSDKFNRIWGSFFQFVKNTKFPLDTG